MRTGIKALLLILSGVGIGVASYFLLRKSRKQLMEEILIRIDNYNDKIRWAIILNQMTRQELSDTWQVMQLRENTPQSVVDSYGPAFKDRVIAISQKYNIFT